MIKSDSQQFSLSFGKLFLAGVISGVFRELMLMLITYIPQISLWLAKLIAR